MQKDWLSICGENDIALPHIGTALQSFACGSLCIFWCNRTGTTVSNI
jgi:hypothetical protein